METNPTKPSNPNQKEFSNQLFSPTNIIAIYTVLSTLFKMKNELGLEAMLEYCEYYHHTLEFHNPKLKYAVTEALELIDVKKIYHEALGNGKN